MDDLQKNEIEAIMGAMECPKDFECYTSGFKKLGKASDGGLPNYVDCLDGRAARCKYAVRFGNGVLCRCSLRVYVAKTLRL